MREEMSEEEELAKRPQGWPKLPEVFLSAGTAKRWVLSCCLSERAGPAERSPRRWL